MNLVSGTGSILLGTDGISHGLTVGLGALVGAETGTGELEATLILGHTKQLHHALLIGGESSDLADEASDESGALGVSSLSGHGLGGSLSLLGGVTLLKTVCDKG